MAIKRDVVALAISALAAAVAGACAVRNARGAVHELAAVDELAVPLDIGSTERVILCAACPSDSDAHARMPMRSETEEAEKAP